MPDLNGNAFASTSGLTTGQTLYSGPDLTGYLPLGTAVTTYLAPGGTVLSPRIAVTSEFGEFDLGGQLCPDGFRRGGVSKNGLEIKGFYSSSLPATAAYAPPGL